MGSINSLIRNNIKKLKPYSSARDEYGGEAAVFLDANENPWFPPLNRYPDPRQRALKKIISQMRAVREENVFLGNGSDEAIDILIRGFCEPGSDNIVSIDPSYGMYEVAAAISGVSYRKVPLKDNFGLDHVALKDAADNNTRIIFLCSPNNPTGNSFLFSDINEIFSWFGGLLIVDEAYIDFSDKPGFLSATGNFERLVVLQTLSKAWGRAGIRLGMAFGNEEVIRVMNKIKPPYNINSLTIQEAIRTLEKEDEKNKRVREIVDTRNMLGQKLEKMPMVRKIYPSDANFLLVCVDDADKLYKYLSANKIIVRNRSTSTGCKNCIRITIGTGKEIDLLLKTLNNY
jgi:histidinol-phosphate aminotransferase